MALYKVLLVDDEEEVRTSIAKKLDWTALGFTLVAEADNGRDALDLAEQFQPDVIMTDIKMPFMDGLTLVEKVQKVIPGIKTAIFSGFDDFEYAKEAITLGVSEYILKPVDAKELSQVFMRIKLSLDEEIAEKRNMEKLSHYYEESLPLLRQQLLFQLLKGNMDPTRLALKLEQYSLNLDAAQYAVAAICYDEKALEQEHNLVAFSLQQIIEEYLSESFACHFLLSMDHMTLFFQLSEKTQIRDVISALNQLFIPVKKLLGISISIGVGGLYPELELVSHSYEEAVDALEYQVLMEPGQCIYIGDIEPGTMDQYPENTQYKDNVIRQIKIGSKESLGESISTLIHGLRQPTVSMEQYQIIRLELSTELLRLCHAYQLDLSTSDLNHILKENQSNPFTSLSEMTRWLSEQCEDLRQRIRRQRKDSTKLLIDQAQNYLQENYADQSLSVETLCNELNVSPAYFSTIFRKETGLTFVSYLTQLRMEKSLEYLNTTDLKTYQIAEAVGYSDANYFSYVFKKEMGISPSKYRRDQLPTDESVPSHV